MSRIGRGALYGIMVGVRPASGAGSRETRLATPLETLRDQLRAFASARDWESRDLPPERRQAAKEEIADVLIYLVRLADQLGIDPLAAAREKLEANERKYPVDKARGTARKYTEL